MKCSRILAPALILGALAVAPFVRTAIASEALDAAPMQVPPYPSGGPVPTPTPTPPPSPTPAPTPTSPSLEAGIAPIRADGGF